MIRIFRRLIGARMRPGLASLLVILAIVLTGCGGVLENPSSTTAPSWSSAGTERASPAVEAELGQENSSPPTGFREVADYIRRHHELPDNFITKKEAEALGWVPAQGNLHKVAPGKSIGGDRFGNREGLLPKAKNRIWYEADIHYEQGTRGADRILYSNDGLIYMTVDHYQSFTDITEKGSIPE
ncbi:ribonuclease domain-containing protein [Cohnella cellulosilytica]|uniref:Ribonuclease n=1 Tax=Cohnella cellulosilytica TaxID=986710 RepID=A0ABW2FKS8_9BACL